MQLTFVQKMNEMCKIVNLIKDLINNAQCVMLKIIININIEKLGHAKLKMTYI